jgi:hypothetical protein
LSPLLSVHSISVWCSPICLVAPFVVWAFISVPHFISQAADPMQGPPKLLYLLENRSKF